MADFLLLVAVDYHQPVAKAVREATPCDLDWVPPPGGQKFDNRDGELKTQKRPGPDTRKGV